MSNTTILVIVLIAFVLLSVPTLFLMAWLYNYSKKDFTISVKYVNDTKLPEQHSQNAQIVDHKKELEEYWKAQDERTKRAGIEMENEFNDLHASALELFDMIAAGKPNKDVNK